MNPESGNLTRCSINNVLCCIVVACSIRVCDPAAEHGEQAKTVIGYITHKPQLLVVQ